MFTQKIPLPQKDTKTAKGNFSISVDSDHLVASDDGSVGEVESGLDHPRSCLLRHEAQWLLYSAPWWKVEYPARRGKRDRTPLVIYPWRSQLFSCPDWEFCGQKRLSVRRFVIGIVWCNECRSHISNSVTAAAIHYSKESHSAVEWASCHTWDHTFLHPFSSSHSLTEI